MNLTSLAVNLSLTQEFKAKPMTLYCGQGGSDRELSSDELRDLFLGALERVGKRSKVLPSARSHACGIASR